MMIKLFKKYFQCIITLITILIIILVYNLTCMVTDIIGFHLYFGWQEINITNSFSIKVPGDWVKGEKDGLIYFYYSDSKNIDDDSNDNIIFFQSESEKMFDLGDPAVIDKEKTEHNIISDSFQSIVVLNSTVNSLGTSYGNALISADDITYNEKYILFGEEYLFYSWCEGMDDEILKKIADSVEFEN